MGWVYHVDFSPMGNEKNSYVKAFDSFLAECIIDEDKIRHSFIKDNYYRFIIDTDGDGNKIRCTDGKIFFKDRFLTSATFKKKLIDYYKPLGVYIIGPQEILKKNGSSTNKWLVRLERIYQNNF